MHTQILQNLSVGINHILKPWLLASSVALEGGICLYDSLDIHVVGIEQGMNHTATVIRLCICHDNDTRTVVDGMGYNGEQRRCMER